MSLSNGGAYRAGRVARGLSARPDRERLANMERNERTRRELTEWVRGIKLESGCVDCGYNAHPFALDFDHLPGTVKVAGVSRLVARGSSRARIEAEIAKCEVVCSNCHRIRTYERQQETAELHAD